MGELYADVEEIGGMELKDGDKYKFILEAFDNIIWELNLDTNELDISENCRDIIGYPCGRVDFLEGFVSKLVYHEDIPKLTADFNTYLKGCFSYFQSEFRIRTKKGELLWFLMRGKTLKSSGLRPSMLLGTLTDTTLYKRTEEQLHYMAYYDSLTNLPNRLLFIRKLKEALDKSAPGHTLGAVVFVDIDNFKMINDTLGHDYGDLLLKIVAELLNVCISEHGLVARHGGDEFLLLIPEIESKLVLKSICEQTLKSFKSYFEVKDKQIYISVSMGVAIFQGDAIEANEILKNADTAMYHAKTRGKNRYSFFDKNMADQVVRKKNIETALRKAVRNNEMELHYQPQIDLRTKKVKGLEALLRWNSTELGAVPPTEFIPVAEETGMIIEIGEWVIRNACMKCREFMDKGFVFESIAVNVSPVQIQDKNLLSTIKTELQQSGLQPENLTIEITEGTFIKSIEENAELLKKIIDEGIKIAIDDFGKGYSSLNYLSMLPIHMIKIDKSFIDRIDMDSHFAIIECILQLADRLHYDTISEGVENKHQVEMLDRLGCRYIQGYYFSKPLPGWAVEEYFTKRG